MPVKSLKRLRNKPSFKKLELSRKAKDVLYEKMIFWHSKGRNILKLIENDIRSKEKSDAKTLLGAMKMLKDADELAIHCAEKLAPYQSPKLESIEVTKKVEHRYVIRAPAQMKNAEEWLKQTGQGKEIIDVKLEKIEPPSRIHVQDFDDEDDTEDERRSIN